jgi:predicted nuclease of predicted toxin-antitoxin system
MKFKLDENFGTRTQQVFREAGHSVQTVRDQGLQGCSDHLLYKACVSEDLCLVTLDLDFADVTRFPPGATNGIVVIRVPQNPSLALLEHLVSQFLQVTTRMSPEKNLWIVEVGRIRIYQSEERR